MAYPTPSYLLPSQFAEAEKLKRRQAVARALLGQSMQPMPGTQVVSGVAVRNSPLEAIGKLVEAWKGGQELKATDADQAALLKEAQDKISGALDAYTKATTPRPATPGAPFSSPEGETGTTPGSPAYSPTAADRRTAAVRLGTELGMGPDIARMQVAEGFAPPKLVTAKPGESVYEVQPGQKPRLAFGVPAAPPEAPNSVRQYEFAQKQGYKGTYSQWLLEQKRAGATTLNVDTKQPSAEAQAVGAFYGKDFADIETAGRSAYTKLANYQRLGQLLQGVQTGKLTGIGTQLSAYAKALGFNVDSKLGDKQAALSIMNQMALQLRNPSGGAGMPGALSDKDREFLMSMVPSLVNTPEGNALILETSRRMAQRDIEVAQMARDYRQQHGHIDEGFYNELRQYSDAHPLFAGMSSPGNTAPQGSGGWHIERVQ